VTELDLSQPRSIHVIGIGGAGMSAIAHVLLRMGHSVSGSDASESGAVARLRDEGARVSIGHAGENLPDDLDAVAYSTAVPITNPEMVRARERGVITLRRAEILRAIAMVKRTLAVAGTHGKTTTSTLLAHVLEAGNTEPSWIIGGEIVGKVGGANWGDGELFVVEADESDGTFVELGAFGVIVTNVEPDHLEFYGSLDDRDGAIASLHSAFDRFVTEAEGPKVVCVDDEGSASLASRNSLVTYGTNAQADYRIVDVRLDRFSAQFIIEHAGERTEVLIQIPGLHNVRNATAAFALGHEVGVSKAAAAAGLGAFQGVGRRFSFRGEHNDIAFVDEYAHLPGEVRAALAAARAGGWKRIVAVFQPHRYSRTEQVGHEFAGAFDDADLLVLNGVYPAGEAPRPGIDGHVIRRAVESVPAHPPVTYIENRSDLARGVARLLQPGDLCITVGAGDITKLSDEVLAILAE
jgi:UDP-N-acetylmuramate--alanine ligase